MFLVTVAKGNVPLNSNKWRTIFLSLCRKWTKRDNQMGLKRWYKRVSNCVSLAAALFVLPMEVILAIFVAPSPEINRKGMKRTDIGGVPYRRRKYVTRYSTKQMIAVHRFSLAAILIRPWLVRNSCVL